MNSLVKQFNYSGYSEYSKVSGKIPVVTSLQDKKFRISANITGSIFYLCACRSGQAIKKFVEEKISKGLKDAKHSIDEEFTCSNKGSSGVNTIFLIAIDDNWKYTILPIGFIAIDDVAPELIPKGHDSHRRMRNRALGYYSNYPSSLFRSTFAKKSSTSESYSESKKLYVREMLVNVPAIPSITSTVTISYGNFEGNDYWGYNIPFYIDFSGDVQSVTIGNHTINTLDIKDGDCVSLNIKNLHVGDNSLPISAIDERGNKSTSSLLISLVSIRNHHNNTDYDDLEGRISDLESRMDDLD